MKADRGQRKSRLVVFMRKFNIRARILWVLILFTVAPTILVFSIAKLYATEATWTQLESYVVSSQDSIERSLGLFNNQIDIFSLRMLRDQNIYTSLKADTVSEEEKQRVLRASVEARLLNQELISGVVVLLKDGRRYECSLNNQPMPALSQADIDAVENMPLFFEAKDNATDLSYTVQTRRYVDFNTGNDIGFLCVYIDKRAMYDVYREMELDDSYSLIADRNRKIISSRHAEDIGSRIHLAPGEIETGTLEEQITQVAIGGRRMIYSCRLMKIANNKSNPNWYLVRYIPVDNLNQSLATLNRYIIAIIILICLVSTFLALYTSKYAIRRIERMKQNMERFGQGDMNVAFCEQNSQDELWFLERSFDEMKIQIENLITKNNAIKESQRESELQALQAQINPHFIYNTLDSIGWMARSKSQPEIVKMVGALASFFRISLHKGDKFITVAEEIEHVKSYIVIEEIRMPGRFKILFDVAEEVTGYQILKILLQPLVENAIKHGAAECGAVCQIRINAFAIEGELHLEVIDSGPGFDTRILDDPEKMKEKKGGYGIRNVNERIKLEYGDEFGVTYHSIPGRFTRAEIILPLREE